jgi:3-deoxy-D-manno-octulosonic-acid transferase
LGETRAAQVLVAALRQQHPGMRLLLTHGTATGREEGAKCLQPGDVQVWQPWDAPGNVRRFLAHFKPRIGILMETEVWPTMAAQCQARQIPLVLANARLSEKSFQKSLTWAWLARPAYRSLTAVWAQTADDAQRLGQLGAPVQGVFGNIKFDATPDAAQLAQGRRWRAALGRPVVLLASSREGEEAHLLALLQRKGKTGGGAAASAQWLIVPRHPQRFDEVAGLIEKLGFRVSRRSQWGVDALPDPLAEALSPAATVWLGDSLGEMALYYGLADVALLGGSFEPLGGQNLIEAAACACPVVMGPHTFNFADAAELAIAAQAGVRVDSLDQGIDCALDLAQDVPHQRATAQAALAFAKAHQGATAQLAVAIGTLLQR